jgi:predicted transcriptional regulator
MSIKQHNENVFASTQRVYLNNSDNKSDVIVVTIKVNWELKKRLEESTLIITYYEELKKLIARAKLLANVTTTNQEC